MTEVSFERHYRQIFDSFGYPLSKNAGVLPAALSKAEKSLGITVPKALLDYYLVAGREKHFNEAHNRLISCNDWEIHRKRLLFMVENQGVVVWSVSIGSSQDEDPKIWQASNEEPYEWYQETRRCSVFLSVMLHYQAINGGMKYSANAEARPDLKRKLKTKWTCYGTVNRMTAYSRQNQVLCIEPDMGILAAGKTKRDLDAIASELELTWDQLFF